MIQKMEGSKESEDLLQRFVEYLRQEKSGGLAETTISRYLINLRHFQDQTNLTLLGLLTLTKYKQVAEVIRGCKHRLGWTGSTPKGAADHASVFYNWAFQEGIIKDSPMKMGHEFKTNSYEQKELRFFDWNSDEFQNLLNHPNNTVRDNVIFHSLRSSGIRATPLCKLKFRNPCDIDLKHRWFRVRCDKGGEHHVYTFDRTTKRWLLLYLPTLVRHSKLDYLVQNQDMNAPLNSDTLYKMVARKAEKIGIEASPHDFRRSFGGNLVERGADLTIVQNLLNHKSVQTTARHYVKFKKSRLQSQYDHFMNKDRIKNFSPAFS